MNEGNLRGTGMNYNLEDYIGAVELAARNKSPIVFENSRLDCAAIIMSRLFKYSKEVFIYDNELDGDISDSHPSFFEELNAFIDRGSKLNLVLKKGNIDHNSRILDCLIEGKLRFPDNIYIKTASEEFSDSIREVLNDDVYFAVNNRNSYRLEKIRQFESERNAICSFNEPQIAGKLLRAFNKSYSSCKDIRIPHFA